MPDDLDARVRESAALIRQRWDGRPRIGLILGTGLSQASERMEIDETVPYDQIPHFVCATALSHQGRLVCGRLEGVPTVALAGRCHLYEGYGFDEVTLPVRVLHALGVEQLIVSNASGGLNPHYRGGDILVMADHINLMLAMGRPESGMAGPLGSPWGRRSVPSTGLDDGSRGLRCGWCYDAGLIEQALGIARRNGITAHCGVYVAVPGPNFETRAEYRMLRRIGGDAVGMSTVPEVLAAASLGVRVLGLSMITNVALPDAPRKVDPHEVVQWAAQAEPHLARIAAGIASQLKATLPQDSLEPAELATAPGGRAARIARGSGFESAVRPRHHSGLDG